MPSRTLSAALTAVAMAGLTGCVATGKDAEAGCSRLSGPLSDLSDTLIAHPETPDPVGRAGVRVVVVGQGFCAPG